MQNKHIAPNDFLKRAASVATYYGFTPIESAFKAVPPIDEKKAMPSIPPTTDSFSEEMSSLMQNALLRNVQRIEKPLQFYHTQTKEPRSKKQQPGTRFGLTVFGIERSVAEALILSSSLAILDELGMHNMRVQINSVGDRDSMQRFLRELNIYLRKNLEDMPALCREALKHDAFDALEFLLEKKHPLLEHAPRPMQFLTDGSRRHLKEIIEFLEFSDVPYEINADLIGNRNYHSQTIFEIKEQIDPEKEEPKDAHMAIYARGGRCDELIKKSCRANLSAVSIIIEQPLLKEETVSWKPPRVRNPKIYFIHLGVQAKLLSLSIIETLRKAHIQLQQTIGNESLTSQLEDAEALGIAQAIIIGQREVLDKTIIVRDMRTHAQTVIPLETLPERLKSMGF